MSEIVILAVCFQLKQLKKQPKKLLNLKVESTLRGSHFPSCLSADHINDFHIFIYIHYRRVYDELTIDYLSMWLDGSDGG